MEDLKIQDKILNLGREIVKQLQLDPGVDTLSKWMAHYLAEKIVLVETLSGNKKKQAQNECCELIIKLWEHRWSLPQNRPYLQDFASLFATLDKLDPNKAPPYFFRPDFLFEMEEEIKGTETNKVDSQSDQVLNTNMTAQTHLDLALRVDKLARSLIVGLLNLAVSRMDLTIEKAQVIRSSINAIDYSEGRIIKFVANYHINLENKDEVDDEAKNRNLKLKNRIDELEELASIVQSLVSNYKNELKEINN